MKKYGERTTIIFVLLSFVFLSQAYGQSDSSRRWQRLAGKIPRISAKLAYFRYKNGMLIIVDSMNSKTYAKYHILGAINLSGNGRKCLKRIARAKLPIPKNMEIIVYCD